MYPAGSPALGGIAARADVLLSSVYPRFIKTREIARGLCVLALYDIVLLLGMRSLSFFLSFFLRRDH